LPIPSDHLGAPSTAELRLDALSLVQRAVQLLAARAAETEGASCASSLREKPASAHELTVQPATRARSGRVRIIPQ
jgi:hypothetical protein